MLFSMKRPSLAGEEPCSSSIERVKAPVWLILHNFSFLSLFFFLLKLLSLSSFQSKKTEQSCNPSLKYELQRSWVKRERIKRWAEAPASLKSFVIAFSGCLLGIHSQSVWDRHSSRRGARNGSQMHRKTSLKPLPVIPKNISSAVMGECFFQPALAQDGTERYSCWPWTLTVAARLMARAAHLLGL